MTVFWLPGMRRKRPMDVFWQRQNFKGKKMFYTVPDYFEKFCCTAGECEDTCCAGWQIVVDEKSLEDYRQETGGYSSKLHRSIDWENHTFRQDDKKRCAFLTEENLCEMYQNLGADRLCKTCREYPRHTEEFEDVREISLSLSCPEAARLVLNQVAPVSFRTEEREGEEEFEGFDPFLYSELTDGREVIFEIVQNRNLPMENRVILMLGLAYNMQSRVKSGRMFSCGDVFQKYRQQAHFSEAGRRAERWRRDFPRQMRFARKMFDHLKKLELLREDWEELLEEARRSLFGKGGRAYARLVTDFRLWLYKDAPFDWNIVFEQLLVYYIYTYFCGAVYDEEIFVNAQMAAANVTVIWHLLAARWERNEHTLDMEDVTEIVYRFSRELEHSEENLRTLWEMLGREEKWFGAW